MNSRRGTTPNSRARAAVVEPGEVAGARERELDLLAFELEEIEAVAPSEEEESALSPIATGCAISTAAARGVRRR